MEQKLVFKEKKYVLIYVCRECGAVTMLEEYPPADFDYYCLRCWEEYLAAVEEVARGIRAR